MIAFALSSNTFEKKSNADSKLESKSTFNAKRLSSASSKSSAPLSVGSAGLIHATVNNKFLK
jgi:hypothetical protein